MTKAPDQILTVAQMQAAEQRIVDAGETIRGLMQTAGEGAAEWIWRIAAGRSVTVLCGQGNNGGDGYVIAQALLERGLNVTVVAPLEPKTDAAIAAHDVYEGSFAETGQGEVLVDCLFGSGLARPLGEDLAALLRTLSAAHHKRIAIDLPSGVESDTGASLNDDLPQYDMTIALGAWKRAHWLMPAMERMGTRKLVDIGVDPVDGAARLIRRPSLAAPPRDAHKYSRGLLAVVGGAMPGAGMLAARAAMHGGAGYVKLFAEHKTPATPDELVVDERPLDEALADERITALAVGPGLGRGDEARARLKAVLARSLPTLCDADALGLLKADDLQQRSAPLMLTPHAGELATLFGAFAVADADRMERLHRLATATGATIVAKGPDTIVVSPDGRVSIAPPAPSWLSTAGTGDVLAGLAASRLATGLDPHRAATEAVWLHGEAARLAGPVFTAGDLVRAIPRAYAAAL